MWASQLNAREKVYRKVNRCGASPSEGCRYVCETICEHKDPKMFPGFKSDGSVHKTCDHSGTSAEEEEPLAEEEEEPHAEEEEVHEEEVEPEPGTVEASRSGGTTSAAAAADYDELETISRPSARNGNASASSESSSFVVVPRRASSGRGLLQDGDSAGARTHLRGAPGKKQTKRGKPSAHHHHHHHHSSHHDGGSGVSTPFYQDLENWGTGYTCYEKCRQTCEVRVVDPVVDRTAACGAREIMTRFLFYFICFFV